MPKKQFKKVKVQGYFPEHIYAQMNMIAEKHKATTSDMLLTAMAMYLSEHGENNAKNFE